MEDLENRIRELESELVKEARVRYSNEIKLYEKLDSSIEVLKAIYPFIARVQREKIQNFFKKFDIKN